jgi:hypothetical protein
MKKTKSTTTVDTGKRIRAVKKERNLRTADLARSMNRHFTTVSTLLKKPSIQVYLLWEFSLALKHNFFADLAEQLNATAPADTLDNAQQPLTAQLAALEKENEQLRSECDLLKKVVDVLGKR